MKVQTLLTVILLVTALVQILLALYAAGKKSVSAVRVFTALMICMALYTAGYAFELSCPLLEEKLLWIRLQYLGIPFIPVLYLLMCLNILGIEWKIEGWMKPFLFVIPVLTVFFVYTNSYHRFYYSSWEIVLVRSIPLMVFSRGPWYYVQGVYILIMFISMTYFGFRYMSGSNRLFRGQAVAVVSGSVLAWIVYVIYLAGLGPEGIDLNPFVSSVISFLFGVALFRYRLIDIIPVARESVFEEIPDCVVVFDMAGRLVDYNASALRIISGLDPFLLGRGADEVLRSVPDALKVVREELPDYITEAIKLDGFDRYFRCRMISVKNSRGRIHGRTLILSDVTEQIMLLRQMTDLASYDYLTGAYNRRYFTESCQKEISRARRNGTTVSILMIDIDHFKSINDTYGHSAGDAVLSSLVERCREGLRDSDIIGRWGGEEFVVFLPDAAVSGALNTAERLRASVEATRIRYRDTFVTVTASFGVAEMSVNEQETLQELIKRADEALYRAKNEGRNRVAVNS